MIKDLNVFQACKKMNIKKLITLGNLHAHWIEKFDKRINPQGKEKES